MKILLINNYDSFTYNLLHLIKDALQCKGCVSNTESAGNSSGVGNTKDSGNSNCVGYTEVTGNTESIIDVVLNDKISLKKAKQYNYIIISPGPGTPREAGNILEIIKELAHTHPILGICLGHQAIAQVFGADIYCCPKPLHGVKSQINILDNSRIFKNMPEKIYGGRYHSWLVKKASVKSNLIITASDERGRIMAISHKKYNVHGIQFHPESFMTNMGTQIIKNFLNIQ